MIRSVLLVAFGGLLLILAVRSLRAHRLKEGYALLFFVLGVPFLALAVWPDAIVWIEQTLRIEKPTVMVFALGTFTILLIFKLLSVVSIQERRITTLAQRLAMIEASADQSELDDNDESEKPAT